ncbi:MarR family winged helix-turn-helix transcriptional regulator [Labedaea rhizosphaerae]|uniref:DNA-binding MarR family transcriptional regulator n=1 Tax=Labedaea rhizosphaerae TaxID=598644 RepID=A0A4R6SPP8_LABRH|nr:MarR family winged helix-turn-helix transcriptional regulator [Labedaea rhizosphaerae]TDQ05213.1 DNA-binding MarR family transcriptional regulator [Labedaea rhizosphaerae]
MDPVQEVERAMIAIRRSQSRRVLSRQADVDPNSVAVLDVIEECEQTGESCTVASVRTALSVDQPRASRLVAKAVEDGFVRREADQHDGRKALLRMTSAGRAALGQVHEVRRQRFAEAMAGWSVREQETFAKLLSRFMDGFAR